MIIGIDLGTTNSLVAYYTDEGPKIIPNRLGERLTPSVVSIDENETVYSYTFINPQIIAASKEMTYLPGGEGCLSVDRDTTGLVTPRHYAIKVKGMIYDFEKKRPKFVTLYLEGYPAIVFQHENDHLDGILYTSKMYKPEEIPDLKPLYTIPEDNEENTDEE